MATPSSSRDPSQIKYELDQALQEVLKNNFDADSKMCVITLVKVLDNIVQKPGNDKVRCIRVSNPNFWQKVGQRAGALAYLRACGFICTKEPIQVKVVTGALPKMVLDRDVQMQDAVDTDSTAAAAAAAGTTTTTINPNADPSAGYLQLLSDAEDTDILMQARQRLVMCATLELKIPATELPKLKAPPPRAPTPKPTAASIAASFNIYQGSRYDGQAAATGVKVGPSDDYKSPTEQSLQRLQQRQKQLEQKMQPNQITDREWTIYRPGKTTSGASSLSTASTSADMAPPTSDGRLLAARVKQQMEQRDQVDNGGFTTKAMRDLAKIKNQKVYSHTSLQIQFSDGCWVRGKFLPTETIASIEQTLRTECLRPQLFDNVKIELYITPPRQVLKPPSSNIASHGLMPAAKVFVSFDKPIASVQLGSPGHYLHPNLVAKYDVSAATTTATSFPQAVPIQDDTKNDSQGDNSSTAAAAGAGDQKKKKPKRNKEEDLLKRMMGNGLGFGKRK